MALERPSTTARSILTLVGFLLVAGCTADGTNDGPDDQPEGGVDVEGPEDGALINASGLADLSFTVDTSRSDLTASELALQHGGDDVTAEAEVADDRLTWAPGDLPDGDHEVTVTERTATEGSADAEDDATEGEPLHTWRFTVDAEPPTIELTSPTGALAAGEDVTVAGVTDPGATVEVGDQTVTADESGAFEVILGPIGDEGEVVVSVTDVAGNTAEVTERVVVVASRVEIDQIRTVHATFWAWATPSLREPIEQMITDGRINSLQLDLKDEGGQIGYSSKVPLAGEIGADIGPLDLEEAVADLHDRGVAVVGRIVAFADPPLAAWAWENDRRDMVIQDVDGQDYYRGSYAGFSNYTHEDVISYLLDLAEEAAQAGVDHILWDYIRRPEGMDNYTVPGLEGTPEEAIVEFTRRADERLAPYGVAHGASVYGIAADRPEQIGQDIPAMAEHLDYVAPMIYPSHWGPGEYDVADPNRQPYDIIRATLEVWDEAVEDRRARVVPWLEDTPYRAWDRPHQVREQIRAARDHGIDEWLMWNPGSTFTPSAYEQRE